MGPAEMDQSIVKRSVRIAGHATSVSLEGAFWGAAEEIAARRGVRLASLLATIDRERGGNLSSAVRLFVLECCRRGELGPGSAPAITAARVDPDSTEAEVTGSAECAPSHRSPPAPGR